MSDSPRRRFTGETPASPQGANAFGPNRATPRENATSGDKGQRHPSESTEVGLAPPPRERTNSDATSPRVPVREEPAELPRPVHPHGGRSGSAPAGPRSSSIAVPARAEPATTDSSPIPADDLIVGPASGPHPVAGDTTAPDARAHRPHTRAASGPDTDPAAAPAGAEDGPTIVAAAPSPQAPAVEAKPRQATSASVPRVDFVAEPPSAPRRKAASDPVAPAPEPKPRRPSSAAVARSESTASPNPPARRLSSAANPTVAGAASSRRASSLAVRAHDAADAPERVSQKGPNDLGHGRTPARRPTSEGRRATPLTQGEAGDTRLRPLPAPPVADADLAADALWHSRSRGAEGAVEGGPTNVYQDLAEKARRSSARSGLTDLFRLDGVRSWWSQAAPERRRVAAGVAALVAGALAMLVVLLTLGGDSRPSDDELMAAYPYGPMGQAGPNGQFAPPATEVSFRYTGTRTCGGLTSEQCLVYGYSGEKFEGYMVIHRVADHWSRFSTEGTPFEVERR